jgi:hypothetical protein
MELYVSEWNNLIKITYLICHSVGGPKKPPYGSHASDPMSWIFNDIIKTGYDLFQPIKLLVTF